MSESLAVSEFNNPLIDVMISEQSLQTRIGELGAAIARDYAGRKPELICVLKGALVFMSDLIRAASSGAH